MNVGNDELAFSSAQRGRAWSWAALLFAVAMWVLTIPTLGISVVLAPIGLGLSAVGWRRAPHDGLFWVGLTLNAIVMLWFVGLLIGLLAGDVGIGFDDSP